MTTRRECVQQLAAGAAFMALGGCRTMSGPDGSGAQVLPPPSVKKPSSLVALVRPSAYPSLADAVRDAVAKAGGLGFLREGQRVLLKPAVNSTRPYPATTDPEVIFTIAQLVKDAGAIPFIADRTVFSRSTALTFHALGLDEAARQAHISCQALDNTAVVSRSHPLATHWSDGAVPIYQPVLEADHLINLCTPRTHRLGDFTMALKNLVGVVDSSARLGMHLPSGFRERLAEINLVVRPSLVVMDGRQGFVDGGPDSGDQAALDFLAVGADPVAIDAVGLAHLRLEGANERIMQGSVWQLPVMRRAVELGLGVASAEEITLAGPSVEDEAKVRAQLS
ncbi:MAG: DUF362 domain-containing protein [Myxococcota bacterium]